MSYERRRAPRYRLIADAEITDLRSNTRTTARTSDFSLVGCFMNAPLSMPSGTKIGVKLIRRGETFLTQGVIARVQPMGMGVSFAPLKRDQERLLSKWLLDANSATEAVG